MKVNISELTVEEDYKNLFLFSKHILVSIQEDMKNNGYDESKPITVWKDKNIVIDGHVRLQAAKNIGLKTIPVFERNFEDEDAALGYAIHHQRDRRDLNDGNILHFVERFDVVYPRGGDRRSKFVNQNFENKDKVSSREVTAKLLEISAEKVSQCRHIMKNCSDSEKEEIKEGKKTIYEVYKSSSAAVKDQESKTKKQETSRTKLEEILSQNYTVTTSKEDQKRQIIRVKKLITLADKRIQSLEKRLSNMSDVKEIIKYFKSDDEAFKNFCEQVPVKRFLGSSVVTDFVEILRSFGYKVATPKSLNVIEEEKEEMVEAAKIEIPPSKFRSDIAHGHEAVL